MRSTRNCCTLGRRFSNGATVQISELIKARFWTNVSRINDTACWNWEGTLTPGGYGQFYITKGTQWQSHRFVWQSVFGGIPDGLWVLHKCDNRKCCNPFHLYVGTAADNSFDAISRGRNYIPVEKKFCKRGHPMTEDNLVIWKCNRSRSGYTRMCKKCRKANEAKDYLARKAKLLARANEIKI